MNIAEIQVEQFGAWRNLTLPLHTQGLTVFHGPNEAGKTTLMRFVRGMLYGFPQRLHGAVESREPMAGTLRLATAAGDCRLHRASPGHALSGPHTSRGDVSLSGFDESLDAREILAGELQGVSESVYEHVFAIGLRELQELATLDGHEVAEHIYGLTLGPEGRRLLEAWNGIRADRRKLFDPQTNTGLLPDAWAEHERLDTLLRNRPDPAVRHGELCRQRDALEVDLISCRQRQAGIQSQLRGHQFLDRVWAPWNSLRNGRRELELLPIVQGFPERGVERLERLEGELAATQHHRRRLIEELRQLRTKSRQLAGDPQLRKHAAAMQGFILQRNWVGDLQQRKAQAADRLAQCQIDFDARRQKLGDAWTSELVDAADVSTAAHHRLAGTARSYKQAVLRRAAVGRACKRLAVVSQQNRATLDAQLKTLGASSLDEALEQARRQLEDLKSLAALRLHEQELEEHQAGIELQLSRLRPKRSLPPWVYVALATFCIAGGALGCWGILTGIRSSEVAGLTYILLGLTTAGIAWGLKSQFESDARLRVTELETDGQKNLGQLEATRQQIHQLTANCDLSEFADFDSPPPAPEAPPSPTSAARVIPPSPPADTFDDDSDKLPILSRWAERARDWSRQAVQTARERLSGQPNTKHQTPNTPSTFKKTAIDPSFEMALIHQVAGRIADLEQVRSRAQQVERIRDRLADRVRKLQACRREVETVRTSWRELLSQLGFPQTLSIDQAFDHWRLLVETKDHRRRCQEAEGVASQLELLWTSFRHRLEELDRGLNHRPDANEQPLDVLKRWEHQLASLTEQRRQRVDVRKTELARRRDLSQHNQQWRALNLKRDALLRQAGAGDREEFIVRSRQAAQRGELARLIQEAQTTLERIAAEHRDLAIVDDDLRVFRPEENRRAIDTLQQELADLDRDLEQLTERLGAVRRELQLVEEDREPSRLRFEREQAASRLHAISEEWLALEAATQVIEEMRTKFERTCQPRVLAMASRHLTRMTGGRYTNIWTPLDRRELRIEDALQTSHTIEQLSSGTRELLFLAVRLALIEDLGQKGVHLPMILDDVFVNLDQSRAEAAAGVLLDFTQQGQQVLFFTCHQHLADLFARKGSPVVQLPEREGRRIAG